ncbi:MAG: DUF4062 domain-containing protein [Saprospirales bacterium]|nr:DUF4062 domain-containing protein [Saprospirales bacterium]
MAIIKTPDQRVRVFISSTINELADERQAAREAIGNLRLIPVFFEAGARPHPPRDLYSAYLDQSHIFLGIYWNSYGWVAPGAEISGLEDEYRLCGNKKPKLIYVKRSAERQPRLQELLSDIEKSDTACYQMFSNAAELQKLIENDLSVLMSEIFETALAENRQQADPVNILAEFAHVPMVELPLIKSEIYGRDEDLTKVSELLAKPGVSLVTLLGAGGTGKTTLSIHLGHRVKEHFKDGVAFIPLAPVTDPKLVGSTIAEILGIQDSGKQSIEQTLVDFLSDKNFLLILDNFEQVVESSKFISDLIAHCKNLQILVTSRTSLHIRNERIYNLSPLALPSETSSIRPGDLGNYSATQLFVERALEVNPRLILDQENTEAILEICRRMDGLPLAIELAAARTRFFQPAALMSRIEKTLDLVSKGQKDLPERQQTLRAAIEWSYNLLTEETKRVFRLLGVFKRSWTLEAADVILNDGKTPADVEEMTERLLDVSLIKPVLVSHSSEPRFNMLQTVHEYAREMLDLSSDAKDTKLRYARYFYELCEAADGHLWKANAEPWMDKIEYEHQNIRAAFYIFIEYERFEEAWNLFYFLCPYWTLRGGFSETMQWIVDARIDDKAMWSNPGISPRVVGRTVTWAGYCKLFLFDLEKGFAMLAEAEPILEGSGDEISLAYAYMFDGCYGSYLNMPGSPEKLEKGYALAQKQNDSVALSMFYCWSAEYYRQQGRMDIVQKNLAHAEELARQDGITYILGALYILRFTFDVLNPNHDYDKTAEDAMSLLRLLPEKGFKGLKAAAWSGLGYSKMMQGKMDEVWEPMYRGLELSRTAGEKESLIYGVMEASAYFSIVGKAKPAHLLFGSLDAFIAATGYPVVGGAEVQYNMAKSRLQALPDPATSARWYEEGKKMRLEDAVAYAMAEGK